MKNEPSGAPDAEKITIIEAPPPTFEERADDWVQSLAEAAQPSRTALTRLRTFNGPALVERCYRAWKVQRPMQLEYRSDDGRIEHAPIVAARSAEVAEGQMLMLWVRLPLEVEAEVDWGEDPSEAEGPNPPSATP